MVDTMTRAAAVAATGEGPVPMAFLEVPNASGEVDRHRLEEDEPTTIGRHPKCQVVLEDDRASRKHCVIWRKNGRYHVRDLDSRNGTKVNERRVREVELRDRDVIRVGKVRIRFLDPNSPPAKHEPNRNGDARRGGRSRRRGAEQEGASSDAALDPVVALAPPDEAAMRVDLEKAARSPRRSSPDERPYDERLREMIDALPGRDFPAGAISLIDSRGNTVHQGALGEGEDKEDVGEGIRALRLLLLAAFRARATDLHLEPRHDRALARLRVDGTMVTATEMDVSVLRKIVGLVKILCQIDTTRQNKVQDGHFTVAVPKRHVDYRVSFTPSMHGQKLVIRILDTANAPTHVSDLGLVGWMEEKLRSIGTKDSGMVLAAGPTGSGKTTSLYTCLREINVEERNVITIEDPVEYSLEGCTQIPVDSKQGNTFGEMLRSVLRQDPDVIYVGEIRDIETARTAMQASMTGHLVFSTVHAKDSTGAIFRLLDLGVEPYLVANAISFILAQRLVRLLCPNCRKPARPTPAQTMKMGRAVDGVSKIFTPVGCRRCLKTGFVGRRAIFEMLEFNPDLRDVVLNQPTIQAIREVAKRGLFHTLQESGYQLVAQGVTSVDEVDRVAGTN